MGAVEHVYDPWHYPDDWEVEGFSPEGPKIARPGGWFYLITAGGRHGGAADGAYGDRGAIALASTGPWENCPHNPIVRTESHRRSAGGRAAMPPLVEGPGGGLVGRLSRL